MTCVVVVVFALFCPEVLLAASGLAEFYKYFDQAIRERSERETERLNTNGFQFEMCECATQWFFRICENELHC